MWKVRESEGVSVGRAGGGTLSSKCLAAMSCERY